MMPAKTNPPRFTISHNRCEHCKYLVCDEKCSTCPVHSANRCQCTTAATDEELEKCRCKYFVSNIDDERGLQL